MTTLCILINSKYRQAVQSGILTCLHFFVLSAIKTIEFMLNTLEVLFNLMLLVYCTILYEFRCVCVWTSTMGDESQA